MDNAHREKSRYGKHDAKADKRKSHKATDSDKWDAKHAQDYLDSAEGQKHAAMLAKARELTGGDGGAEPPSGDPSAAPQPAMQPGAMPAGG